MTLALLLRNSYFLGSYYFSTHGCNLVLSISFAVGPFEEDAPFVAAAAARVLLLKKFDMIASRRVLLLVQQGKRELVNYQHVVKTLLNPLKTDALRTRFCQPYH